MVACGPWWDAQPGSGRSWLPLLALPRLSCGAGHRVPTARAAPCPPTSAPQMARGGARGNGPAPGIERLGIQPYNWNTECLRGDGEAPGWATAFPQALGLAASFR